jgi:hypothetical protein
LIGVVKVEPLAEWFLGIRGRCTMSDATNVQREAGVVESREEAGSELARHMDQQTGSIQTAHKLILVLEAVGAILYIGLFILAIYVSVTWKAHGELAVPRWWMASQVCAGVLAVIVGLHTLVVKAYLPVPYPNGKESIVTGREAARQAWMPIGLGLLWAAVWGGMYLYIVLSSADPLGTFIPFVVIVSVGIGVASGIWAAIRGRAGAIQKRRRSQ